MPAGDPGSVVDVPQQDVPPQPAPRADGPRAPTVFGREVAYLALLLRQGEHAWCLAGKAGNHEFAKAFYADGKYNVREGTARVGGGIDLLGVELDAAGATFHWSSGLTSQIPRDYYQATWA